MKLDLDEIQKLTPPGLHNLRPMLLVVEVITALITKQVVGSPIMLKLIRTLGRYQKQARDNEAYNLAVRIKFWVMAEAERRAWVRRIIGENNIRRWQERYDNLHRPHLGKPAPKRQAPTNPSKLPTMTVKPYVWKRFAMANLSWLEFTPLVAKSAYFGDILGTHLGNWHQPRETRGFKPVEFWAFELADDYQPPEPTETKTHTAIAQTHAVPSSDPEPPPKKKRSKPAPELTSTLGKPP